MSYSSGGVIEQKADFNGSSSYISLDNINNVTEFSICAYVNQSSFPSTSYIYDNQGSGSGIVFRFVNNLLYLYVGKGSGWTYTLSSALSTNTTYRCTGTYSDTSRINDLYVNTVKVDTATASAAMVTTTKSKSIGSYQGTQSYINGWIDEWVMFGIKISEDLDRWLHNGGSPTTLQQYPFEETVTPETGSNTKQLLLLR